MKENQKLQLSYFGVFKVWLCANIFLILLYVILTALSTNFTHDGLYDAQIVLSVIACGFIITLPSLFLLLLANYFYKIKYSAIPIRNFYVSMITFINLVYLIVTEIKDPQFLYLLAYLITTLAGILSLYIVHANEKIMYKPTS